MPKPSDLKNAVVLLDVVMLLAERVAVAIATREDVTDAEVAEYRSADDLSRASLQAKIDAARAVHG